MMGVRSGQPHGPEAVRDLLQRLARPPSPGWPSSQGTLCGRPACTPQPTPRPLPLEVGLVARETRREPRVREMKSCPQKRKRGFVMGRDPTPGPAARPDIAEGPGTGDCTWLSLPCDDIIRHPSSPRLRPVPASDHRLPPHAAARGPAPRDARLPGDDQRTERRPAPSLCAR